MKNQQQQLLNKLTTVTVMAMMFNPGTCTAAAMENSIVPGGVKDKSQAAALAEKGTKLDCGKYNVLFIAVDDLRTQLGCYGQKQMLTPNLDRLASTGVMFTQAYCQQALCSPTRTSLLTGKRPDTTKIYDLTTHFRKTIPDTITLPENFKNHGYYTVGIGKVYHLNDKQSWDEYIKTTSITYALPENENYRKDKIQEAKDKGLKGDKIRTDAERSYAWEAADVDDNKYHDGQITDKAVEKLREIKNKRFFFAVGYHKPHLPFCCPKKYWDLYDPAKLKLADNPYAPKDCPTVALHDSGEVRRYLGIPKSGPLPDDTARKLIHGYYACTSFLDAQVGRLMKEIEDLKLENDTIIILWGDHGWQLGEHGLWCKHTNFELATRVPLILRVPGTKNIGVKIPALTEYVDIYPTLCELTGLPLPEGLEGVSMVPLLDEPNRDWKSAAFSQYPRPNKVMGYTMRTKQYRYAEWKNRDTGEVVGVELYDHQSDPGENVNLALDKKNKDLCAKLSAQLNAGWKAAKPK
ncbi:MAG: sulfatase [Elusimicrobiota bacterium]